LKSARAAFGRLIPAQAPGLKRIWLFLFVAALYVLLGLTVHLRLWAAFDLTITLFLDQVPRSLDPSLSVFSLIGSAELTGLFILAYTFFFCPPGSRVRLVVLFALIAFLEWVGKNVFYQPSPPGVFYHYVLPFSFPTSSVETPYSFPSGHAARSVFVTLVLVVWIQQSRIGARGKQALMGLLAIGEIVMLLTRISLGEHWFSDVIGGILLATALVLPWLYSLKPASFPLPSRISVQPGSPGD
jgi:membrane-associated phospholipid phosphatase